MYVVEKERLMFTYFSGWGRAGVCICVSRV